MADPTVHADQSALREVTHQGMPRSARSSTAYRGLAAATDDLAAARELAGEDPAFAEEVPAMRPPSAPGAEPPAPGCCSRATPTTTATSILEIKAGEGGEESALFAGDLLRMYLRYAEQSGWKTEVLDATESDLGGYKDVTGRGQGQGHRPDRRGAVGPAEVRGRRAPRAARAGHREPGAHPHLGGRGARDARVDEDDEVEIDDERPAHRRLPLSGPGGQSVNTTDSAVRITHLPTGTVVSCQNEKSQLQNKESAMRILRARLRQAAAEAAAEATASRAPLQVRTVDRSERIRTYNFPENRIADHRTGFKAYNLDAVLGGELDPVVAPDRLGGLSQPRTACRTGSLRPAPGDGDARLARAGRHRRCRQ
jgi:peptide chain release factor 1